MQERPESSNQIAARLGRIRSRVVRGINTYRGTSWRLALQFDIDNVSGGLAGVLDRMRLGFPENALAGFIRMVRRFPFRIGGFRRAGTDDIKNIVRMGMHWHFLTRLYRDIEDAHSVIIHQHFVHRRRNLYGILRTSRPCQQASTRKRNHHR